VSTLVKSKNFSTRGIFAAIARPIDAFTPGEARRLEMVFYEDIFFPERGGSTKFRGK
jgi:hypothetical protein